MKKVLMIVGAMMLAIAMQAQTKTEAKVSAQFYYDQAQVYKQQIEQYEQEQKLNTELMSAPDGKTKYHTQQKSNSRRYLLDNARKKYNELMEKGRAIEAAEKERQTREAKALKDLLTTTPADTTDTK